MAEQPLSAASLAQQLRQVPRDYPLPWRMQVRSICASTELELDRWLQRESIGAAARVVVAHRQGFGHGQQGRVWSSPAGGLWLSAALPWTPDPDRAASLALAVAVGVALQLEDLGLEPAIKWPNDLLVSGLKLCGFLPRLAWRAGRVRHARVGLGLNGTNSVPAGAVSLQQLRVRQRPAALGARVLRALEWAAAAAEQPELVRRQAQQRLWNPGPLDHDGQRWNITGLSLDGGLQLENASGSTVLRRRF